MKLNAPNTSRKNAFSATAKTTVSRSTKRFATDSDDAASEADTFVTVQVPFCPHDGSYNVADAFHPYLQIINRPDNTTLAAVLRDPDATADFNDKQSCAPQIFTTQLPSDPIYLEASAYVGAGAIVKPTDALDTELMSILDLKTQVIEYVTTATRPAELSMAYDATPNGIYRQLVDAAGQQVPYSAAASPTASLVDVQSLLAHIASAAPAPTQGLVQRRHLSFLNKATEPTYTTYTATLLGNKYFDQNDYLNFLPTATLGAASASTTTAPTDASGSQRSIVSSGMPSLRPHAATVTTFLPGPTSYVQANVMFQFKGANPNVALSFANYGAVVTLAAAGAMALVGFVYLRSKRAPAAAQTTTSTTAPAEQVSAPAVAGDIA